MHARMARLAAVLARIKIPPAARWRAWGRSVLLLLALAGHAAWQPVLAADDFLEPEKAFQFSARPLDAKTIEVTFDIAPGYYLYREQFRFASTGATLGPAAIPPGKVKFDQTFQKNVETYRDTLKIAVPVTSAAAEFRFVTTSQGCADAGLCYPPMESAATVSLAGFGGNGTVVPAAVADAGAAPIGAAAASLRAGAANGKPGMLVSESGAIDSVLR